MPGIKSPREAAEYFCWISGNDNQIEPLTSAFETRDNYWRLRLKSLRNKLEARKQKAGGG